MKWRIALSSHRPRVAMFVSKHDHCLVDLLYRQRSGELACDIAVIVSNHPDARPHAEFYGIPYCVDSGDEGNQARGGTARVGAFGEV